MDATAIFPTDLAQKFAKKFLQAYLSDLEYWTQDGVDSVNHVTCGTPFFENERELDHYIRKLKACINNLPE